MATPRPGDLFRKDPSGKLIYDMDWGTDGYLGSSVTIATSTWAVSGDDAILTTDNASLPSARVARVRLLAGTLGKRYTITNHIITNESPTQEDDRSFDVLIQNR